MRNINEELLSQEEISNSMSENDNIGRLIGDIIINRKVGILLSKRNLKAINVTIKMIEKELQNHS